MAGRLLPQLRQDYDLRLVDIVATDVAGKPVEGVISADLTATDRASMQPLFEGIDVVVHLGYQRSSPGGVYDESVPHIDRFDVELANVRMANNVYRCSYDAGVRRVVVASSNHAADWYEHAEIHAGLRDIVTPDELPLSDNFYGWAKASYELLGFPYACGTFGRKLEIVHVRIGAPREIVPDEYLTPEQLESPRGLQAPAGIRRLKRDLGAYLSIRDGQQLFKRCIETVDVADQRGIPWLVVYGISDNTRAFWSLASSREVLGYRPEDDADVVFADALGDLLRDTPGRLGPPEP